ncbi:MAG: hypothetical protein ACPG31_09845 [Planctomycetota bacterium]
MTPTSVFDWPALSVQLQGLPGLVVAFSGGVDSTVLLAAALEVLGRDKVVAVLADSPSLARAEKEDALRIAHALGATLQILDTRELEDPRYRANSGDRCFWCKEQLFTFAAPIASERGWPLAYGENASDVGDHRPGARSAALRGVLAPLREAGWHKEQVRAFAAARGLDVAEKPAAPCLASRVAVGVEVDLDILEQVESLESALKERGYRILRARHLGGASGALEFEASEMPRATAEWSALQVLAAEHGFSDCSLRTYRSGSVAQA